jgi:fatty acid synthase subunit alpha
MATRMLKAKYEARDDSISHTRSILCHAKNAKEIYYQFEDEPNTPAIEAISVGSLEALPPIPSIVSAAPTLNPAPTIAATSVKDVPIKAIDILNVIIAQKLKKRVEEVPLTKTIKDLVGGKSTLQNEILGDLQLEFTSAPKKAEGLPLEELGLALGVGFSGALGKVLEWLGIKNGRQEDAWRIQLFCHQVLPQQELGTGAVLIRWHSVIRNHDGAYKMTHHRIQG